MAGSGQGLDSANCEGLDDRASTSSSMAVELGLDRERLLDERAAEAAGSGSGSSRLDFLARAIGVVAHALGVGPGAVGLALDQGRPVAARARATASLAASETARTSLPSTSTPGQAVAIAPGWRRRSCPRRTGTGPRWRTGCSRRRTATGSFQMLAMFSPSWKAPLLTAPSPKKATATRSVSQELEAVAGAGGLEDARADDPAGAHHADLGGEQVHAAAAAVRAAGGAAEQLGDQLARRRHPWPGRGRGRGAC